MIPMMKRDGDKVYYWLRRRDGNLVGFHAHNCTTRDHHGPNPGIKVYAKKNVDLAALKLRGVQEFPGVLRPTRLRLARKSLK